MYNRETCVPLPLASQHLFQHWLAEAVQQVVVVPRSKKGERKNTNPFFKYSNKSNDQDLLFKYYTLMNLNTDNTNEEYVQ